MCQIPEQKFCVQTSNHHQYIYSSTTVCISAVLWYLYSLLNLRDELGLKFTRGQQPHGGLTIEEQFVFRQLHQQQSNNFSQIHAADHLLKATGDRKVIKKGFKRLKKDLIFETLKMTEMLFLFFQKLGTF